MFFSISTSEGNFAFTGFFFLEKNIVLQVYHLRQRLKRATGVPLKTNAKKKEGRMRYNLYLRPKFKKTLRTLHSCKKKKIQSNAKKEIRRIV